METLALRLTYAMEKLGFNPNSLAQKIGVTRPAMAKIVKGETLEPKKILEIANALDVDVQWLKTGEGKAPDFAKKMTELTACTDEDVYRIDILNKTASGGFGAIQSSDITEVVSAIEYNESNFRQIFNGYHPEDIKLINVKGDSMSPTIESGDLLFVHIRTTHYDGDGVYVFTYGDALHVKRLQKAGDELLVLSDNPNYQKWKITEKNSYKFHVHAKVLLGQSQQLKRFG